MVYLTLAAFFAFILWPVLVPATLTAVHAMRQWRPTYRPVRRQPSTPGDPPPSPFRRRLTSASTSARADAKAPFHTVGDFASAPGSLLASEDKSPSEVERLQTSPRRGAAARVKAP